MPYYKDLTYFASIDTEEKAYFLGLLYADGWISGHTMAIELHHQDRAILERLSMAIFGCLRLRYRKPYSRVCKGITINCSGHYTVAVSSVQIVQQLAKLGMFQKKSETHSFPTSEQVPPHLVRHFIRGYFDGDGCLSHRTAAHAKRWIVTIVSSQAFCDHLRDLTVSELDVPFLPVKTACRIAGVCISGNRQIKRFMDWIYADATVCLERKQAKYAELCADIHRMDTKPRWSKYRNVSFDKRRGKWTAAARLNKRTVNIGRFLTEEEAYVAQQAFIKQAGKVAETDASHRLHEATSPLS